jgi:hypothetical protein
MKKTRNNKKGVLAIAAVVKIIGVVLFLVSGIAVITPMAKVGDKLAAEKCRMLFDTKLGMVDTFMAATVGNTPDVVKSGYAFGGKVQMTQAKYAVIDVLPGGSDSGEEGYAKAAQQNANLVWQQVEEETRLALFEALPKVCGTIKTSCTGSVREVAKCLHEKIKWTYYSLSGGKYLPYERQIDLFEVSVKVTEPSEIRFWGRPNELELLKEIYTTSIGDVRIIEEMPFATWYGVTVYGVNLDTMKMIALENCYDQPGGPADTRCDCFYHPEEGYSLSQGFRITTTIDFEFEKTYPQYPGYFGCGAWQPGDMEPWFWQAELEWVPRCNFRELSALPGYENKTCTLTMGVNVIGEEPIQVTAEAKSKKKKLITGISRDSGEFVGITYGSKDWTEAEITDRGKDAEGWNKVIVR